MFTNNRAIYRKPKEQNNNTLMFTRTTVYSKPPAPVTANHNLKSSLPGLPVQKPRPSALPSMSKSAPIQPKVLTWGPPYWYLFHGMAEKVKPEKFPQIKSEMLNLIFVICQNLPCPDCTNHAVQYLNGINFKAIQTKEELKDALFIFHNSVNERKGNPMFSRTELDAKYSKANVFAIWKHFMNEFTKKHKNNNLIASDFHRENISKVLRTWYQANANCFD